MKEEKDREEEEKKNVEEEEMKKKRRRMTDNTRFEMPAWKTHCGPLCVQKHFNDVSCTTPNTLQ